MKKYKRKIGKIGAKKALKTAMADISHDEVKNYLNYEAIIIHNSHVNYTFIQL